MFILTFPAFAATTISDTADLEANSDISAPGIYLLDPGKSYIFDTPITIRNDSRNSISFAGSGETVTLDNVGINPLLIVNAFTLSNGAFLIAQAGGAGGYALQTNTLTISDTLTTITATGGTGAGAQGIRVEQGGILHRDGTVQATGGTAANTDGINVIRGGYTMDSGTLVATGGDASNAAGLRVTAGGFTMNDGIATVRGGAESNAAGLWVAGNFVMNGGNMTVNAGTTGNSLGNAHGIRATGTTTQTDGNMIINGGGTTYSVGLYTSDNVILGGGSMIVSGGSGGRASGIDTNGKTMTVGGNGSLTATAGSGSNAHGIFSNIFEQTGGAIDAHASNTSGAYGITGNTFRQSGGSLTATAGDTSESRGVSFGSSSQTGGSITATGGAYNSAFSQTAAFFTTGMNQSGGTITGYGGSGSGARGFSINNTFTQGGDVIAYGGSGETSYGVGTNTAWNLNGGGITAIGGSGSRASGAYTSLMTMTNGSIDATGGSGASAHGISGSGFTMANGAAIGTGGSVASANGIDYNSITLNNGDMMGHSGSVTGAHGISAAALNQNGGAITAQGGTIDGAYGVRSGNFTQSAASSLIARGGASTQAYGMYVSSAMNIGGTVRLERPDRAGASIYVNGNGLTFFGGSVLTPVVDISELDGATGSGLIQTAAGSTVTINPGAFLNPWFIDRHSLARNAVTTDYLFLDTQGGVIDGVFSGERGGLAIEYVARKINDDSQYVLTYERVLDTDSVINLIPCINARTLVMIFENLNDPADLLAEQVLSSIDFAPDLNELYRVAAHIGRTLTPIAYTKLTNTQLRTTELIQDSVFRQLDVLATESGNGAFSDAAWPSLRRSDSQWQTWASGLYQQSSRFEARCREFDSPKEKLYGVSTGIGRNFDRVAVAGGFSYVSGAYKSGYSDIDVDNYGVTLGVKVHDLTPSGGWFSPWASLVGGYVYGDVDQKFLNYTLTDWKTSSPSAHMYRASAEVGNDFRLGGAFALTPIIGVDYAHVRQAGYSESDSSGNGLRVCRGTYDSLRPRAGFALGYSGNKLDVGINAFYRYEAMDEKSTFNYSRLSAPGVIITAEGEKRRRSSGSIGATAAYRVNDRVSLNGSYDLLLEDGYTANRFAIGVGVAF